MRVNFGKRLVPISTLGVGTLFVGAVFAMGLFAFGEYVAHVRHDADSLLVEASTTARQLSSHNDATDAGDRIAARFIQPALLVVFVGRRYRVTVLRENTGAGTTRTTTIVRDRDDRRLPEVSGLTARLTLGLATAFGLSALHAHAGKLDITVEANPVRLVDDVRGFLPAFLIATLIGIALAVATARVMTRSALRPLDDVTRALERFSAGDFTPEFIDSDGNDHLSALALAYNGAVEQVERSFAERARANAMMRQFIADAGHQLRTPLTVIRGFIGIVRSQAATMDHAELSHVLDMIRQQTLVMGSLIDRLILLDQLESARSEVVSVADLTKIGQIARELVEPLSLANPSRSISLDVVGPEQSAFVDPDDVRHVIANLIDNALKYTSGQVRVSIRGEPAATVVSVADDGPGMSDDSVARAFDRFFRGERRDVEGSGLGLAIAKRAAERSGGTLRLHSSVERGTCVTALFPRAPSEL